MSISNIPKVRKKKLQYVAKEAWYIEYCHKDVVKSVQKKLEEWNISNRAIASGLLLDAIRKIQLLLERPTVRGHLDPKLRIPEVDENSSFKSLLKRLGHLANAASILADLIHIESTADDDESEALEHTKQTLEKALDNISLIPIDSS